MLQGSTLGLNTLLQQLYKHIQDYKTGVFFIATTANNSCRFALKQGQLTHCSYQRWHGEAALQGLKHIEGGTCAFYTDLNYPFRPQAEIDHTTALHYLNSISAHPSMDTTSAPQLKPSGFSQTELEQLFGRFYFE